MNLSQNPNRRGVAGGWEVEERPMVWGLKKGVSRGDEGANITLYLSVDIMLLKVYYRIIVLGIHR